MSYRIEYTAKEHKDGRKCYSFRLPVLSLLCFALFYCLVQQFWSEGKVMLDSAALRIRDLPVFSALQQAADQLRNLEDVMEVFSVFNHKILS